MQQRNQLQSLRQVIEKGQLLLQCSSKNPISLLCISRKCKASASYCFDRKCQECCGPHRFCQCIHFDTLTDLLRGFYDKQHRFAEQLMIKAQNIINEIRLNVLEFEKETCLGFLSPEELDAICAIYLNRISSFDSENIRQRGKSTTTLIGANIDDLYRKLLLVSEELKSLELDLVPKFEDKANKTTKQLRKLQETAISQFKDKFNKQLAGIPLKIDSTFLKEHQELRKRCVSYERQQQRQKQRVTKFKEEKKQLEESISILTEEKQANLRQAKQQKTIENQTLAQITVLKEYLHEQQILLNLEKRRTQNLVQMLQLNEKRQEIMMKPLTLCEFIQSQEAREWITAIEERDGLLKSKILSKDKIQDYKFIYESLSKPASLKLLFRASEHNFSAIEFHQHCDGSSSTFTLIKTEFGKIIGGFTPCKWNSPQSEQSVADSSESSFLLSIDLKQKMNLIEPEKAILCWKKSGPTFGRGKSDIYICDRCNVNNSHSNFPQSYNFGSKYKQTQETWVEFSGAKEGKSFRVVEYEVFLVEF